MEEYATEDADGRKEGEREAQFNGRDGDWGAEGQIIAYRIKRGLVFSTLLNNTNSGN